MLILCCVLFDTISYLPQRWPFTNCVCAGWSFLRCRCLLTLTHFSLNFSPLPTASTTCPLVQVLFDTILFLPQIWPFTVCVCVCVCSGLRSLWCRCCSTSSHIFLISGRWLTVFVCWLMLTLVQVLFDTISSFLPYEGSPATPINAREVLRGMCRVSQNVYICTIYDHIFGYFPAKVTVYTPYICMALANPRHVRSCTKQGDLLGE